MHTCSMCRYPCAFLFSGDTVRYDAGCDCVKYGPAITSRTWDSVAGHYNLQSHPEVIKEMNTFWGFTE